MRLMIMGLVGIIKSNIMVMQINRKFSGISSTDSLSIIIVLFSLQLNRNSYDMDGTPKNASYMTDV